MIFFLKNRTSVLLLFSVLVLSSCDQPKAEVESWSGGDLKGVNHTRQQIRTFSVNGSVGPNIGSFGERGGACCISLPDKWRPGLKADVVWVVSTNSGKVVFPGYDDWEKYEAWEEKIKEGLVKYHSIVDIPNYGNEKCGLTVHFLPCNQIKVTASCWAKTRLEYPIKEPREMEEPAECP